MRALLLDRDGVINRERPDYVKNWGEFEPLPGALAALSALASFDGKIVVITNQSAIGRGLVERAIVDEIHHKLLELVVSNGGRIDAFFVCPHHPDEHCGCRKPKPGLLLQAADMFDLNLPDCVFIGDSISDFLAAQAVGCSSILVQTGIIGARLPTLLAHHSQHAEPGQSLPPEVVLAPDLAAVVEILGQRRMFSRTNV
jgi:D-glycero-D-manno-heptose 1,7-bisphosphate phosphatase